MWEADLSGGIAFVLGAEGKGLRPLVRRTCDLEVSIPQLGRVESLNVSVAAALLLYEARRQRRVVAEPTLYLFDGFNLLHAGGFGSPEELRDLLASWVAAQGARGVLVFDGQGADERHGALEVRWAKDADALLERLAAENRSKRAGRDRLVGRRRARHERDRGAEALVADVPRRALAAARSRAHARGDLRDRLDPETLAQLERLRRGEG